MLQVFAPAKINLCLHVTGQRPDGYHLLDSVVGFADIGDWVTLRRGKTADLQVTGPEAPALQQGGVNIITQTLASFGASDVAVVLDKRLPVASGMGGGSADAAAAYRGMNALLGRQALPQDVAKLLALGADVPMCVASHPAHITGIGETITPILNLAPLCAVLVNPRAPLATPDVFRRLIQKENPVIPHLPQAPHQAQALTEWLALQRNDLQPAAIGAAPVIADVLAALAQSGAGLARMSGSGATCFGLYPTIAAAHQAADNLRLLRPNWWVAACTINAPLDISPQAMRATT